MIKHAQILRYLYESSESGELINFVILFVFCPYSSSIIASFKIPSYCTSRALKESQFQTSGDTCVFSFRVGEWDWYLSYIRIDLLQITLSRVLFIRKTNIEQKSLTIYSFHNDVTRVTAFASGQWLRLRHRTDLANTQTPPPPREPTAPASSMDFCPHPDVITFAPQLLDWPPELQSV